MCDATPTKQCRSCSRLLPVACFGSDRSTRDGRERRCRACISAKNAAAYRGRKARRTGALGARFEARGDAVTL